MTESMRRTLVVTKHPKSVPALVQFTRSVLAAMKDNPHFPRPTPSMETFASALAELDQAQIAVLSRTRGVSAERDARKTALVALIGQVRTYVQGVVDQNPETAATVIASAGMSVKRPAVQTKRPFDVKPGRVSGSVRLLVRSAGDRASYRWQWSTDGGLTWHDAPATTQAKTEISGLPVGKTCWFRFRVTTKDGERDWSEPLSIVVT